MRAAAGLASILLLAGIAPAPARAEPPLAFRACGGLGVGGGHRSDVRTAGACGMLSAGLAWRCRPGRALVASFDASGGPLGVSSVLESAHLNSLEQEAVTVGLEISAPRGSGIGIHLQAGLGMGQVTAAGTPALASWIPGDPWPPADWRHPMREWGPAFVGEAGFRLVPRPGPVGFVLGLRASHVVAAHSSSLSVGALLGLTVYPL
jgi:hypothetical protein